MRSEYERGRLVDIGNLEDLRRRREDDTEMNIMKIGCETWRKCGARTVFGVLLKVGGLELSVALNFGDLLSETVNWLSKEIKPSDSHC